MAAYDKQFLDNTGLNTTVNALWTKLKKVTPYYSETGTDGTNGWVKFLTVRCQQYMNQPLVVHLISRGYSYSTMEIQWVSSGGATPTVSGFYHIIRSFNGTDGKSTNVGYTYEDIDSVRYYHFWKQKNEAYGILHVSVDGISKYISGSDDTGYLTFPNEHSTTEPTGIVYATEVWDSVPVKTAVAAAAKKIGMDKYGQVVIGDSLTKSDVGLGNVDNTSDANKPISTATQTALDGKVSKAGDTMTGQLVNTAGVANAIQVSHGTANTNASISMVRTDTGTQMYVGIGSSGTNHGVYSNTNGNWIIKASTAGNVTINDGKATSTVAIGNSDVGSTTKPVYLDDGIIKEGSTYAGGTKVTLNGTAAGGSTASFYAPTGAGTNHRFLRSNGSGAPTWMIPAADYTFNSVMYVDGDTKVFWAFRLKGITNDSYNNILLSIDTYFWNNQKSSSDLIWIGWSNNGNQGLVSTAGRFRIQGKDNTGTPLEYYLVKNTADTAAACTVDLYIRPASAGNSYGAFYVNVLNSGNRDLGDIIEKKGTYNVALPATAAKIPYTGTIGSADTLSTARELAVGLGNTSTTTTFDGSADVTNIKVSGTLPIANGGTGATTVNGAQYNLLGSMAQATSDFGDNSLVACRLVSPSAATGAMVYRTGTNVWSWIKGKLSSDTGVNISGNAATATKLAAGKELAVSLSNTSTTTTFDGSANVTNIKTTGTLGVGNGGTGMTTASYKNAVVIGNSSTVTNAMQTVRTGSGAFYATAQDGKPQFGTLPVAQGGTGATDAGNARTNLSVYSKSEVDSMLGGRIEVVASLPSTGEAGVIYYVGPTGSGSDQYDEYIWSNNAFVKVGEHSIDLSNYVNSVTTSGSGSVVTGVTKSGNVVTVTKGNIAINNLSDWASNSDVSVGGVTYHTWWPTAPTSSNQVYGLSIYNGKLYQVYNNKGTYSVRSYDQDNNTTYTNASLGQGYGTCSTAQATAEKAVTLADYALVKGGIVAVKFTNALCASATLNINTKGAKPVYINGAAVTSTNAATVAAGDTAYFMYDGTAYHLMGTDRAATNPIVNITRSGTTFTATRLDGSTFTFTQQDNNTTYTQEKLGQGYGTCSTAEATAAKVVALADYELVKNGVVAIKFSYGLCASATLNINSKGAKPVFINGAAATSTTCKEVQAGDIALFIYDGTQYHFLVSDRVSKSAITGLSISGKTITYTRADASTGTITTQDTTYNFADSYDASTNKGATVATVTNAINALDVTDISGFGTGKTLATLKEENGKISATFQNISITKSQVSDFSHTHGNIQNGGTLQTTDITIANGDKLVVTDASDSNKVARASLTFDGATTNQMLSKKGDWSDTIAKARAVVDYGATTKAIEIGWSGAAVTSPAYFAVYTDSANGYNKAIKDCSLANVKKVINGTSKGSSTQPTYIDANGVPTAIDYTIESNVPSGAVFTDTKQNITLATTTKAFITGVSTTPTSTAQALTGLADTGVYLTTTAGELNATQYKVNEHCTMKYNSTKSSLDFTFS